MSSSIKSIQAKLNKLPAEIHTTFVGVTPKKTGNARRKTRLIANRTIRAGYPYARRLDNGYSKQAPQGMIKPTKLWARKRLKQILRKK